MKLPLHRPAAALFSLALAGCSASSGSGSGPGGTDASSSSGLDAAVGPPASVDGGTTPNDASVTPPPDAGAPANDGALSGDVDAPLADGGELVPFVASDETTYFDKAQENVSTGTITFGQADPGATDDAIAALLRKGGSTALTPSGAEEIVSSRMFSFGTFRFRLRLATCASTEEVVNGPFGYFNDGQDHDGDGIVDNREIDIEILCGEPSLINLTIWTEYSNDGKTFRNQSRIIDFAQGYVYAFLPDSSNPDTSDPQNGKIVPAFVHPGWPDANTFYELGWEWAPDHLRYFIVDGGTEVTLWNTTNASRIPQAPVEQHFNIWAPGTHWFKGGTAAVPAKDAVLSLDWFRYDPL